MTSFPTITATVAALIGLLAVLLAARVIVFRVRFKVNAGDGGHAPLAQAIRAHANLRRARAAGADRPRLRRGERRLALADHDPRRRCC